MWYDFEPRPTVAEQRAKATALIERRTAAGETLQPVRVEGRKIVKHFWGRAWCEHLKAHCDAHNRLDKGRSYVCNGLVIDLDVKPGHVDAQVLGTHLYDVTVMIHPLPAEQWEAIQRRTAGQVGSLVELLQGKLSDAVLQVITDPEQGLFPSREEMRFTCTCPDAGGGGWMCKHIAAVLYGVGARLDESPELLFTLRGVDHLDLIESATDHLNTGGDGASTLATEDLSAIFGIDLGDAPVSPPAAPDAIESPKKAPAKQRVKKAPKKTAKRRSKPRPTE